MSSSDLIRLWAERDIRYADRRRLGVFIPLSEAEREAIVTNRRLEALALPPDERVKALTELSQWAR